MRALLLLTVLSLALARYDPWKKERTHARTLAKDVAELKDELFAYEGTRQYDSMAAYLKNLEEQLDLMHRHKRRVGGFERWEPSQEDSLTDDGLRRDNDFFEQLSRMMKPHPRDTRRTTHVDDNRLINLRLQPVRIWRRLDSEHNRKFVRTTLQRMQKSSHDAAFTEAVDVYLMTHPESTWNEVDRSWRSAEKPRMAILVALKNRVGSVRHSRGLFENALYGFYPPFEGTLDVEHAFETVEDALEKTASVEKDLEKAEDLRREVHSSHVRVYIHLLKRLALLRTSMQNDVNDVASARFRAPDKLTHSRKLAFAVNFAVEAERKLKAVKVLYDSQIAQHFAPAADSGLLSVLDAKEIWMKALRRHGADEIDHAVGLLKPEPGSPLAKAVANWVGMVPTKGPERPLLIRAILESPECHTEVPELIATLEREIQ